MPNGFGDINVRPVRVDLKDVYGATITDRVEITFYNQRVQSLKQRFTVQFQGAPAVLKDVPAFPLGLAEVFIKPTRYRYKSIIADIPAGDDVVDLFAPTDTADYTFFVDPQQARPVFPTFEQLRNLLPDLSAILQSPNRSSAAQWFNADWWNDPNNNQQKGGLLNIYAKSKNTQFADNSNVMGYVKEIWGVLPARLFEIVDVKLHDLANSSPQEFHSVSGALHQFRPGWHLVDSYKTFDSNGNLQLTFAQDDSGEFLAQGKMMSDTDIDDHQGIQHAFDVIKHTLAGGDSNPYDIHEILMFFQQIDPGYRLL